MWNIKDSLKNVSIFLFCPYNKNQWCPRLFWIALTFIVWSKTVETCKLSLNYLLLCSAETTKVKHVWNEVRMSKWRQSSHFWVNYTLTLHLYKTFSTEHWHRLVSGQKTVWHTFLFICTSFTDLDLSNSLTSVSISSMYKQPTRLLTLKGFSLGKIFK